MNTFNLYLVTRTAAWECSYDELREAVVRAKSAEDARGYMEEQYGDEEKYKWLDPKFTHCKQLTAEDGEAGIVVSDFWEA